MTSFLFNNQSTRLLGAALILLGTTALPSQATTLTGFTTTGNMMAGMRVTASFVDGFSESVTWQSTGSNSGGAFGSGWSLTESDNSFDLPWTFSNTNQGITSLVIDAIPGNSVFDNVAKDEITSGSADGWGFETLAGQSPNSFIYSDPIDISRGDLFGKLSLYWTSGFTGTMKFRADTDTGSSKDPVKPKDPVARDTPPTVDFSLDTIYEGESTSTTLFATQPGENAIAFFLNGENLGTNFQRSGTRSSPSKDLGFFDDNGEYTYTALARDENGRYSTPATKTLTVLNLPPALASLDIPTIYEGQSASAFMTATDPGADAISFFLNDNDVGTDPSTEGTRSITADLGVFADNTRVRYTGYALDKDGAWSDPVNGTLRVLNLPPTLNRFRLSSNAIYQGESVSALLASTDPGADSINFLINGKRVGTNPNTSGVRRLSTDLGTFTDVGTYTFEAVSRDKDRAFSNQLFRTLTVLNVAPEITSITDDLTLTVGDLFDFTADATDPGINDLLTYNWDLNGDGIFDDFTGSSGQWAFADPGSHQVGLEVSDGNGGYNYAYFKVEINLGETPPDPEPNPGSACGAF
jgi:hypothetical protein